MTTEDTKPEGWWTTIRFYITALAVLVAIMSSFIFLFLVPFFIDPAFSTIFAEFVETPTTCITLSSEYKEGMSNCTWASCREGCTADIFKCTQIYVEFRLSHSEAEELGINLNKEIKLHPNVKGCGYYPEINCTEFEENYKTPGTEFPCYYSKLMPDIALTSLDLNKEKLRLTYCIAIPWSLFLVSVLYLLFTYAGMNRPDPKTDEPMEVKSLKGAARGGSECSLRSIGNSINQGVNKLRGEIDEKESDELSSLPVTKTDSPHCTATSPDAVRRSHRPDQHKNDDLLLEPSTLQKVHARRVLPPLERTPTSKAIGTAEPMPEAS